MGGREDMFQCERLLAHAMHELNLSFPGRIFEDESRGRSNSGLRSGPADVPEEDEEETHSVLPTSTFFPSPSGEKFSRLSSSSEEPHTPESESEAVVPQQAVVGNFRLSQFFSLGDSPSKKRTGSIPMVASPPSPRDHGGEEGCMWQVGTMQWERNFLYGTRLALEPWRTQWLALGTLSGAILVWKFPIPVGGMNIPPNFTLQMHNQGISALLWVGNDELVSASIDETLVLWKPCESNRPLNECRVHATVSSLALHPKIASIFIAAAVDGSIRFYSLPKLRPLMETVRYADPLTCISASPDGCTLAAGSSFGILVLFSLQSLRLDAEIDCRNRRGSTSNGRNIVSLDWSRDSQFICVGSLDSRVRVVHLTDLSRRTKFKAEGRYVNENLFNAAIFGGRERRIIAVSEAGNICTWEVHGNIETNDSCITCEINRPTGNAKIPEITASQIFRNLPLPLVQEIRMKNDHAMIITADTNFRLSLLVEFPPKQGNS